MKTLTMAALGLTLLAGTALAQSNPPPASKAPAATPAPAASSSSSSSSSTSTNKNEQNASSMNLWQGSKLIGLNVYDAQNEKIGDIKEILMDKDGKAEQVAIGVGGFLGMGEHDIAVSMDKLKFVEEPVRTSSTTSTKETTTTKDTTTGTAAPANTTTTARTTNANDWVPDHAVMSATKEQLKAMPQFKYSDYN